MPAPHCTRKDQSLKQVPQCSSGSIYIYLHANIAPADSNQYNHSDVQQDHHVFAWPNLSGMRWFLWNLSAPRLFEISQVGYTTLSRRGGRAMDHGLSHGALFQLPIRSETVGKHNLQLSFPSFSFFPFYLFSSFSSFLFFVLVSLPSVYTLSIRRVVGTFLIQFYIY